MKTLYESLLDDEEDLIENDELVAYNNLIKNLSKTHIQKSNVVNDKNGISIRDSVFSYNWLGSIPFLSDIYYINRLKLDDEKYSSDLNPIHIHEIDSVSIADMAWKIKGLKVDYVRYIDVNLNDIDLNTFKKIMNFIKETFNNIEELEISAYYTNEDEDFKMKILKEINGFKVNNLSIYCKFFIDYNYSGKGSIQTIKSEKNSQMFDELFRNNKIQNLRVRNMKSFRYSYNDIIPNSRARFGYKIMK